MHEIHPNLLWIGNSFDGREPRSLFDAGITSVIDVAFEERPAQLPRQMTYCRYPLNDGGGNDPKMLRQTLRTAINFLSSGFPTLIACSAGMSRSPTIAAFALAHHLSKNPEEIIAGIAGIRSLELNPELWRDVNNVFSQF